MKILTYTSPARGHLYPIMPVLDELASRGHEIAVRTLASHVPMLVDQGFAAGPIAPEIEAIEHDDYLAKSPIGGLRRVAATIANRAHHDARDLRAAIESERPGALLIDCMAWGATAVAETWVGPWAQWVPFPLPLPAVGAPPLGTGLKPDSSPLGRIRDRVLGAINERALNSAILPRVNPVREKAGAAPIVNVFDQFTTPPLILYMSAEPFEYPHPDWPDTIVPVGACAWDPPTDPPEWLGEVDRPLVLVNTSSEFQDDGRLITTALEGLAGENVFVVATSPSAELPVSVPANARVEKFVPHGPLLDVAACAITHGGMGATQKALSKGVPVCAVPFGRDQRDVARRVELARAGVRLPSNKLTPAKLRDAVTRAMGMRDGAERVARGYEATGGPATAADRFEALAASGRDQGDRILAGTADAPPSHDAARV